MRENEPKQPDIAEIIRLCTLDNILDDLRVTGEVSSEQISEIISRLQKARDKTANRECKEARCRAKLEAEEKARKEAERRAAHRQEKEAELAKLRRIVEANAEKQTHWQSQIICVIFSAHKRLFYYSGYGKLSLSDMNTRCQIPAGGRT